MASSTETASCIFQIAEGRPCGDQKVYGTGKEDLKFCWAHYILRCIECRVTQALFECAMVTTAGTSCRQPICSSACYKAHQKKHQNWQPTPRLLPIQVVFADGSVHDHNTPETALTDEIVFENPTTRERARCLRKPSSGPDSPIIYAEMPRAQRPLPSLESPKQAQKTNLPYEPKTRNAVTAFSLHVSWLTALIETRDPRILRVLPADLIQRLELVLAETASTLLESNNHG
jgi:hypothetical protein